MTLDNQAGAGVEFELLMPKAVAPDSKYVTRDCFSVKPQGTLGLRPAVNRTYNGLLNIMNAIAYIAAFALVRTDRADVRVRDERADAEREERS